MKITVTQRTNISHFLPAGRALENVHSFVRVHVHVRMGAFRSQRAILGVVPWVLSTLLCETVSLPGLELTT